MTNGTDHTNDEEKGQGGSEVKPPEPHTETETSGSGRAEAALQVICLGSGGGPSEDNVTGFLVRSLSTEWSKGSLLAVDAGSHLAAITRILQQSYPFVSEAPKPVEPGTKRPSIALSHGPFAGIKFPHESARANALHLLHSYISCYLITHPHLDHLSGFAINTAALHGKSKPKTLAALPSTVDAVKRHIFNDIIWPNLSDEDGGVGFVTFQRLKEGGDPMVGEGDARGYIDVCDGLSVKALSVSHGMCTKSASAPQKRGSISSNAQDIVAASMNGGAISTTEAAGGTTNTMSRSHSFGGGPGFQGYGSTPGTPARQSFHNASQQAGYAHFDTSSVVDSTAYFLRDEETAREILMFGDVEPDTVSMQPRNERVWAEAALKVLSGVLKAVFIECSFADAVADETLFGHLCPRHLIRELRTLGGMISSLRADQRQADGGVGKKRKRSAANGTDSPGFSQPDGVKFRNRGPSTRALRKSSASDYNMDAESVSPRAAALQSTASIPHHALPPQANQSNRSSVSSGHVNEPPLSGITVVIIHIKDTLKDGPPISETILAELQEHEAELKEQGQALGCDFVISQCGENYRF